jgi:outer membrane protein OmpA-like peptidoglycan-associated protein
MQRNQVVCSRNFLLLCGAALLVLSTAAAFAQDNSQAPKTEIYGGYAWQDPNARFNNTTIGGMAKGYTVQSTFFFTPNFGLTLDSGASFKHNRANINEITFGPTVRANLENVSPFLHVMVGMHRVAPAFAGFKPNTGVGAVMGGGLDLHVNRLIDLRVISAEYMWAHHNYPAGLATREYEGGRIGGGIVFKFGSFGPPPAPPAATCSAAAPAEVNAGEPVSVTITPENFNPKAALAYSWTATGGKPAGTAASTQVDTAGLAPGSYTVTGTVSGGKFGKQAATASCNASFTVKEPPKNPPTISCSANPTEVKSGEPSTVTANASSPDNRPVTISYRASSGRIAGTGNTATLDTAGAAPGPISVSCTATDDRGLTNSANTSVTISAPPPPPPTCNKLNDISFARDTKRPARVDNEAKAILDDFGKRLQSDANAKAIIVGHATADETKKRANKNLAQQRAVNAKDYLAHGESQLGIDPSRIEVRTGTGDSQTDELWFVPGGAQPCNPEGSSAFDDSKVKAQPRVAARPAGKKGGAKKKAAPAQ